MEQSCGEGGDMDQMAVSEAGCPVCSGQKVAFLWSRDVSKDGRWVINEAVSKQKNDPNLKLCRCEK